jgi:hypothetical protein
VQDPADRSISRPAEVLNGEESDSAGRQPGPFRRVLRRVPPVLRIYAPIALVLIAFYGVGRCGWPSTAAEGRPEYGVNFSCKQAQYLGLDCTRLFATVLDDLGVRHVRIAAYWSDIERRPGVYDFSSVDRLLDMAAERGAGVTVSVGMKGQRYPEFWFPAWLRRATQIPDNGFPEDNPLVQEAIFPYLEAAARHIGAHPAVEAIQVENEPFVHFQGHANGWHIRKEFLAREIATVRAADPGGHPIVVSHASWVTMDDTWRWILENTDAVAQSVYTKRQRGPWPWLYIFPYRIGPLTPDLPGQARVAAELGKQLWIGELQAEPYEHPSVDIRSIPTAEAASFSPRWLRENVRLAARSGASRVYLWGVEWWAYLREKRGEPELWEEAKSVMRNEVVSDK